MQAVYIEDTCRLLGNCPVLAVLLEQLIEVWDMI
jgi:hypothetical protein